jgi:hypothetical protein
LDPFFAEIGQINPQLPGTVVMILKIFLPKSLAKILWFFAQTAAIF